ncbi:MAG: hypothetical protein ACFCBV_10610, partial [Phycisphaerales bacterium]
TPRRTWEDGLYRVTIGTFSQRNPVSRIWTGLIANAILNAQIPLALHTGLRLIRTRRRRTRNLCIECAYELGDGIDVCPECGLKARTRA